MRVLPVAGCRAVVRELPSMGAGLGVDEAVVMKATALDGVGTVADV